MMMVADLYRSTFGRSNNEIQSRQSDRGNVAARQLCWGVLVGLITVCSSVEAQEPAQTLGLWDYLNDHCIHCHGTDEQKADRNFEELTMDLSEEGAIDQWQEILDVINRGDMPPPEEPQPYSNLTKRFVAELTGRLRAAIEKYADTEVARFRRLNRVEYRNTIRDLCGLNVHSFDPTVNFPADERVDGFENIGEHLVLSDYLLQKFLDASSAIIDKAAQVPEPTARTNRVFGPDDLENRKFHFRPQIQFQVNVDSKYVDIGHGDRFSDRVQPMRFRGVPYDGYYTIRVKAEGINREHPYDPKLLGVDRDEPIKMEVLVADPRVGGRLSGNATDRSVALVPLRDHQSEIYEYRVWMDKGFVPLVRYANGPQPIKAVLFKIAPRYHAESLPSNWRSGTDHKPAEEKERYLSDVYLGPRLRIHSIELDGPHTLSWDQTSHAALFGDHDPSTGLIDPDAVIRRFLWRAYRRPPLESEVSRYQDYMRTRVEKGEKTRAALLTTFKAILCSPGFLYIEVPPSKNEDATDSFLLASRLSYFLWSSMPDEELMDVAQDGSLNAPEIMLAQVRRMLNDPKARAFTQQFTDSWLRLNELGTMPPDTVKFAEFYRRRLQSLMKTETQTFFDHMIRNNLRVELFIDSDFTFLNRYLADHYGIDGVVGDEFRKVKLPADSMRRGLLGHASILTVTSNGVETSPVTRGIWVLENLLGNPPALPPPDVNPLEPDIRGATTIREQLAKHRNVETCAECHRKIDPYGFALECFDPVGAYREKYVSDEAGRTLKIDTSGRLATGEEFADVAELTQLLLKRQDQFVRCLTEKMLTYALGRELSVADLPQVDSITESLARRGGGLRDLVELIVLSEAFRAR